MRGVCGCVLAQWSSSILSCLLFACGCVSRYAELRCPLGPALCREKYGEEDTYAFACAVADIIFFPTSLPQYKNKDNTSLKYRTFCLPDMEQKREDKASLEYVIWRMTQQAYPKRLHDFDEMRTLVKAVTHVHDAKRAAAAARAARATKAE